MSLEALMSSICILFNQGAEHMYILIVLLVLLGDTYLGQKGEVSQPRTEPPPLRTVSVGEGGDWRIDHTPHSEQHPAHSPF